MKTSRIKLNLPLLTTRDDAESCMTELANTINNQRKLTAQRDAQVLAINQKFESNLAACDQAIKEKTDALRAWAEANPDQFPKGRKSVDLVSGILGFRTGTPKLALLSRAWNWDKVKDAVRFALPGFIRTKEEVNKDAILQFVKEGSVDRDETTTFDKFPLSSVGLKVVQDESFFIEPRLTTVEPRQTVEA